MSILLDTNVLLRLANPADPRHGVVDEKIRELIAEQRQLMMVPQTNYEFWVAATRSSGKNGLNLSNADAFRELTRLRGLCDFMPDTPAVFTEWEAIVQRHEVRGKPAHDARLVAAMRVHDIGTLLTLDERDFRRYSAIELMIITQGKA